MNHMIHFLRQRLADRLRELARGCDSKAAKRHAQIEGITMWSLDITREVGPPRWLRPKVQGPWLSKGVLHLRAGWRFTAWGLHLSRRRLDEPAVEALLEERQERCADANSEQER